MGVNYYLNPQLNLKRNIYLSVEDLNFIKEYI